jgi:hypothetical protein
MTSSCIALLLLLQNYPYNNPYKDVVLHNCPSQTEMSKKIFENYK